EFFDHSIDRAPNHITTKRIGDDLHISFERDGQDTDLIIEEFYNNDQQALIGIAEDGQYYHYIPDTGEVRDYVTQLAPNDIEGQALGGEHMIAPLWVALPAGGFPWWLGLGLVPILFDNDDDKEKDTSEDTTIEAIVNSAWGKFDSTTGQNTTVTQDVIDNDPNKDTLDPTSVKIVGGTKDGKELVVDGEGTWTVEPVTGTITFTPESGFLTDPTPIEYTVTNNKGLSSKPTEVVVRYIKDDELIVTKLDDGGVLVDVTNNDSNNDIDPTSVKLIDPQGNPVTELTVPGEGTWTVNDGTDPNKPLGTVTFTPETGFKGEPSPVEYTITDNNGNTSPPATISIQIKPTSEADKNSTSEDNPVSGNVLDNDNSPDGSPLHVKDFSIDTDGDGFVDKTYQPGETADITDKDGNPVGTIIINKDGSYTFTPAKDWNGEVPSIQYTAEDENGNTDPTKVTLKVTPVEDPPVATEDTANTPKNTPKTINVTSNDNDPDGNLDPTSVKLIDPDTGKPTDKAVTIPDEGTYTVDPDGKVTFTPDPKFIGESTIDYIVSDKEGNPSKPTPIKITVAEGAEPETKPDDNTVKQDVNATGNVLANDTDADAGDTLTVKDFSLDTNGDGNKETFKAGETATITDKDGNPVGTLIINKDGSYTFDPEADFTGTVPQVTYTATDGKFDVPNTLDITVDGVPDAKDDTQTVPKDEPSIIDVLGNDSHPDGDKLTITDAKVPAEQGTVEITPDGKIKFTPNPKFNGTPEISYTIEDENGDSDTAKVTLTLIEDKAPIAEDNAKTGKEDFDVKGNVLTDKSPDDKVDTDPEGQPLKVTEFKTPDGNTHKSGDTPVAVTDENGEKIGEITVKDSGDYIFTPEENWNGTVPSIEYTIADDKGLEDTAKLDIIIKPVYDAPEADDQAIKLKEGETKPVSFTEPKDVDTPLEQLTIEVTELPKIGKVTKANGDPVEVGDKLTADELKGLNYTAPKDYTDGEDIGSFKYKVTDDSNKDDPNLDPLTDIGEATFKI
ncbi:MAG: hypothetical protein CR963_00390, partial [Gammaproteobacteria bacterium]